MPNENTDGERGFIAMSTKAGVGAPTRGRSDEDYYVLSFGDILRVLWQRLWIIVLFAVVFMGVALGYSFSQTPEYEANASVLIGQAQVSGASSSNLSGSDIVGLQSLTGTMATAVSTRRVAEAVIQELDLSIAPEDFLKNLSAEQIPETQFVEIKYENPSPQRAQQIANAVSDEFSRQVSKISSSANAVTATVWERAEVPEEPVSPKPLRNALFGFVLGAILGITLAFLLENLDDSWRSVEEVEQVSGVPTVGIIPAFAVPRSKTKKVGPDGENSTRAPITERVYE